MSSILDTLIVDRGPDAHYNATDLNRVGEAVLYVSDLLMQYGYSATVNPRTDWEMTDFPTETAMRAYLADVAALRDAYFTLPTTPELPESMAYLGYEGANAIEKLLADVAQIIEWMIASFHYAGQFYSGELVNIAGFRFARERTWGEIEVYTGYELELQTWGQIEFG